MPAPFEVCCCAAQGSAEVEELKVPKVASFTVLDEDASVLERWPPAPEDEREAEAPPPAKAKRARPGSDTEADAPSTARQESEAPQPPAEAKRAQPGSDTAAEAPPSARQEPEATVVDKDAASELSTSIRPNRSGLPTSNDFSRGLTPASNDFSRQFTPARLDEEISEKGIKEAVFEMIKMSKMLSSEPPSYRKVRKFVSSASAGNRFGLVGVVAVANWAISLVLTAVGLLLALLYRGAFDWENHFHTCVTLGLVGGIFTGWNIAQYASYAIQTTGHATIRQHLHAIRNVGPVLLPCNLVGWSLAVVIAFLPMESINTSLWRVISFAIIGAPPIALGILGKTWCKLSYLNWFGKMAGSRQQGCDSGLRDRLRMQSRGFKLRKGDAVEVLAEQHPRHGSRGKIDTSPTKAAAGLEKSVGVAFSDGHMENVKIDDLCRVCSLYLPIIENGQTLLTKSMEGGKSVSEDGREVDEYRVKSMSSSCAPALGGIAYRNTENIHDFAGDDVFLPWGSTVKGEATSDEWLKVEVSVPRPICPFAQLKPLLIATHVSAPITCFLWTVIYVIALRLLYLLAANIGGVGGAVVEVGAFAAAIGLVFAGDIILSRWISRSFGYLGYSDQMLVAFMVIYNLITDAQVRMLLVQMQGWQRLGCAMGHSIAFSWLRRSHRRQFLQVRRQHLEYSNQDCARLAIAIMASMVTQNVNAALISGTMCLFSDVPGFRTGSCEMGLWGQIAYDSVFTWAFDLSGIYCLVRDEIPVLLFFVLLDPFLVLATIIVVYVNTILALFTCTIGA